MATRNERIRSERDYGDEERGFLDRAGDEMRSWMGDEDAERRRRADEREQERSDPDRRSWPSDRHWSGRTSDRWGRGGPSYGFEPNRENDSRTWREPSGRFAGLGPKGYQRSDDRILEDVNDRLTAAADVDASDIEVSVAGGEVTLSGSVQERRAKHRAEDVAESVSGVRDVHNQLRVSPRQ